jgi:hypothetical protein
MAQALDHLVRHVAVVAHYVNRRTGERTIETTRADRQRD